MRLIVVRRHADAVKACDGWIHPNVIAEIVGRGVERDSEREQYGKRVYSLSCILNMRGADRHDVIDSDV